MCATPAALLTCPRISPAKGFMEAAGVSGATLSKPMRRPAATLSVAGAEVRWFMPNSPWPDFLAGLRPLLCYRKRGGWRQRLVALLIHHLHPQRVLPRFHAL